ncbi:MAG: photosynthetic complex putative assembly protein PuhB [Pseudomonadota bacterium]
MSLFHDEETHGGEPSRGLPQLLPRGEKVLWQGAPRPLALAIHALHIRPIGLYFAGLMVWNVIGGLSNGVALGPALANALPMGVAGLFAVGILFVIARMMARASVYTITTSRVVIRSGVALRKYINLPFAQIAAVALKARGGDAGDLALELTNTRNKSAAVPLLHLWPHARPFRLLRPVPLLRGLSDAKTPATVLVDASKAHAETSADTDVAHTQVQAREGTKTPSRPSQPVYPETGPLGDAAPA